METNNKPLALTSMGETEDIGRKVLIWLNGCPYLPKKLAGGVVLYETLPAGGPAMAISTIQGAYITRRYIMGGYRAEYQFKLIYRVKHTDSVDLRLQADALLDRIGDWAGQNLPALGDGIQAVRAEATSRSSMFAAYEGGTEDHQILMKITYEVI